MSILLHRIGRACFERKGMVLSAWLVLLAMLGGLALVFSQGLQDEFSIPGTESQIGLDNLQQTFPEMSGSSAQILFTLPDSGVENPETEQAVAEVIDELEATPEVSATLSPYSDLVSGAINDEGNAGIITVQLSVAEGEADQELRDTLIAAGDSLADKLGDESIVSVGGTALTDMLPHMGLTEGLGVIIALILLFITFRSLLASVMPLINAIIGVGVSLTLIFMLTAVANIPSTSLTLALMIGLAVGIDYSLFILSRHRDELSHGLEPEEAAAKATATAGSAVVFAGLTVAIALLGLSVAGIPFLSAMGNTAAMSVGLAVLVSLTLTPALLGFGGERLRPKTSKRSPGRKPGRFARAWVDGVTKKPIVTILAVVATLGIMAIPATSLTLALPDSGSQPVGTPARDTNDLIAEYFGPGYNSPLMITANLLQSTDPVGDIEAVADILAEQPGVESVPLATPDQTGVTGVIQLIPMSAGTDAETAELVHSIRDLHDQIEDETGLSIIVTGFTAVGIDISELLGQALLPFGILVVGLSLILLMIVFRSIAVPVKATLGYLLSVCAAFGATAAVFVWGWGADFLDVNRVGPVISFLPIILMGVLFGLAMDYEVFLVSRMREEFTKTGDADHAVRYGFITSAQVVVIAALIMFFVFAAFVPQGDTTIKPIAFGLAVGVFVDAFLVRMTLVPAVMKLLGPSAWYLPKWLDRVLPHFDVEGESLERELALATWPTVDSTDPVVAEGLGLSGRHGWIYRNVSLTVTDSSILVLEGPADSGKTALCLTLAGRMHPEEGTLKVCGRGVPDNAAAVRSRVAVVQGKNRTVMREFSHALKDKPEILIFDDLDSVVAPAARIAIIDQIQQAQAERTEAEPSLTVILGCQSAANVPAPPDAQHYRLSPQRISVKAL